MSWALATADTISNIFASPATWRLLATPLSKCWPISWSKWCRATSIYSAIGFFWVCLLWIQGSPPPVEHTSILLFTTHSTTPFAIATPRCSSHPPYHHCTSYSMNILSCIISSNCFTTSSSWKEPRAWEHLMNWAGNSYFLKHGENTKINIFSDMHMKNSCETFLRILIFAKHFYEVVLKCPYFFFSSCTNSFVELLTEECYFVGYCFSISGSVNTSFGCASFVYEYLNFNGMYFDAVELVLSMPLRL